MADHAKEQNDVAATDIAQDTESPTGQTPHKTTIQPANWPVYSPDHAQAELKAMELLAAGCSIFRVKHLTRLSTREVNRLANIVAEEAACPQPPRIVGRTPLPARLRHRPARIRVVPAQPQPEPVQMSFLD